MLNFIDVINEKFLQITKNEEKQASLKARDPLGQENQCIPFASFTFRSERNFNSIKVSYH
jgi:hypothetical protein